MKFWVVSALLLVVLVNFGQSFNYNEDSFTFKDYAKLNHRINQLKKASAILKQLGVDPENALTHVVINHPQEDVEEPIEAEVESDSTSTPVPTHIPTTESTPDANSDIDTLLVKLNKKLKENNFDPFVKNDFKFLDIDIKHVIKGLATWQRSSDAEVSGNGRQCNLKFRAKQFNLDNALSWNATLFHLIHAEGSIKVDISEVESAIEITVDNQNGRSRISAYHITYIGNIEVDTHDLGILGEIFGQIIEVFVNKVKNVLTVLSEGITKIQLQSLINKIGLPNVHC